MDAPERLEALYHHIKASAPAPQFGWFWIAGFYLGAKFAIDDPDGAAVIMDEFFERQAQFPERVASNAEFYRQLDALTGESK